MTVSQSQGQIKRDLLSNTRVSVEFSLIYILGLIGWKCPVPDFLDFLLVERTWGYISQLMFLFDFFWCARCFIWWTINHLVDFFFKKRIFSNTSFQLFSDLTDFGCKLILLNLVCENLYFVTCGLDLNWKYSLSLFFTLIIGDWLHLCIEFLPFKFSQDLVRYGEFLQ